MTYNVFSGTLNPALSIYLPHWYLDRFRHFCTAHGRVSLYFTMGRPFPLRIADLHGGFQVPSNVLILHLQRTVSAWIENPHLPAGLQHLRTLCWRVYWTELELNMVPWPHPSTLPKQHLIRFSRFCQDMTVTDQPTDRPCYSICNSRPHLRSTAVCPNNNSNSTVLLSLLICHVWLVLLVG